MERAPSRRWERWVARKHPVRAWQSKRPARLLQRKHCGASRQLQCHGRRLARFSPAWPQTRIEPGLPSEPRAHALSLLSAREYDLLQAQQSRPRHVAEAFFRAGQRIDARELAKAKAAARLDRADRNLGRDLELRRGERAEHEFLLGLKALFLAHFIAGCTEFAGVVVDKGDDLPERARNEHAVHLRVAFAEVRAGKDGNLHFVFPRMLKRVVLERQPDRCVERLHLRRRVRHMHGIFVAAPRRVLVAPARVLPAGHVTTAELGRTAVALAHDLLIFRNAWIPLPAHAWAFLR